MPATLGAFGRRLREVINSEEVFEILSEGDWGAGGCWILAEGLVHFLGPPARLMALSSRFIVDHVVVEYGDIYIDYLGAQTLRELIENNTRWMGGRPDVPDLALFTMRLQRAARKSGIPCEPWQVNRLISALNKAFA